MLFEYFDLLKREEEMTASGQKAKILIVDDYAPNILALKVTLEGPLNYDLYEASSGVEAIKLCKQHEFALIILDIQMPDLDGFETAKAIKNCQVNKDTPIIFVTAFYQADPFVQKGYEAGAIDYFGKPFEPNILKAKVGIYTELYLKTKRLQETASLLRSHDQIKTLLDNIPVGIVVADVDGFIFENNEEAKEIWGGIKRCRIEDLDQYKGWHSESGQRLRAEDWALTRALKSGEISNDELVHIECFDGTRKTIWNSAYPIKGKDGETVAAVAVFQDVETTPIEVSAAQKKWKSCLTLLSS
jgi:CheY-like chemotaxis protein